MRTLKTYKELTDYIDAFGKKNMSLLIIVSKGGLGKTTLSENVLIKQDPVVFKGHVTPLAMYKELFFRSQEEKDFITIFDDVDALLGSKTNVALLKQLCETRENKTIRYSSTSHILRGIPSDFEVSCKVLMMLNDVETLRANQSLKALLTRAHLIYFEPSDSEVLSYLKTFSKDNQIINFLTKYVPFSENMNFRVYERAAELKKAKLNWKDEIINSLKIDSKLFELHSLMELYHSDKERLKHFEGSRMTYYRTKKKLLSKLNK